MECQRPDRGRAESKRSFFFSPSIFLSLARANSLLFPFPVSQFRRTTSKGNVVIREGGGKCSQQGGAEGRKEEATIRMSAVERIVNNRNGSSRRGDELAVVARRKR